MQSNQKYIDIKGARENNLKNIDLEVPKNSLTVFTGLSGSGKTYGELVIFFPYKTSKLARTFASYI